MAHLSCQKLICKMAVQSRLLYRPLMNTRLPYTCTNASRNMYSTVVSAKPYWIPIGEGRVFQNIKGPLVTSGLGFERSLNCSFVFLRNCRYIASSRIFRSRGCGIQRQFLSHPRWKCSVRNMSSDPNKREFQKKVTSLIYIGAVFIFMVGASYAAVPLYRIFCQATGLGGQAVKGHDIQKVEKMTAVKERVIKIRFNADVASSMQWNFRPQQTEIKLVPGETALAFYTAKNPTDKPIIGISTYNVIPFEAGPYFNKIQCFCFEEQRLNPHEQVDMPVFFFIDPEFAEDPKCAKFDMITLSYTFFEAKEGLELPYPGYATTVYSNQTPL